MSLSFPFNGNAYSVILVVASMCLFFFFFLLVCGLLVKRLPESQNRVIIYFRTVFGLVKTMSTFEVGLKAFCIMRWS